MKTFLAKTFDIVSSKHSVLEDLIFVLPTQRACVFLKKELKNNTTKTAFSPQVYSISDFLQSQTKYSNIPKLDLIFAFFKVYKNTLKEKKKDDFDTFSGWASTVLQDFNEIDSNITPAEELLDNLTEAQRLEQWGLSEEPSETLKNHFNFIEDLKHYYLALKKHLIKDVQQITSGMQYREFVENIDAINKNIGDKKIIFLGFNALNRAEEIIFQYFLKRDKAEVYWDGVDYFMGDITEAGYFMNKYKKNWKYYENNEFTTIETIDINKKINIIGCPKNISQVKYLSELLNQNPNYNNTAIVLGDEKIIDITLNSLPDNLDSVNITMGYPLKNTQIIGLIDYLFKLHINSENQQDYKFNYKDIVNVLTNYSFVSKEDILGFNNENKVFYTYQDIKNLIKNTALFDSLEFVFSKPKTSKEFLIIFEKTLVLLSNNDNPLELEHIKLLKDVFEELKTHIEANDFINNKRTVFSLYKQILSTEKLSFKGSPTQGLQLMGLLETRVLDFEKIYLCGLNEKILPKDSRSQSFIPIDIKKHYHISSYKEKDAIFSYHFHRLLHRAKEVYLLYNTEIDSFGSGEPSRFIKQLELVYTNINKYNIVPKLNTSPVKPKSIAKTDLLIQRLDKIAEEGFSPSSIANYLYNPMAFYNQRVLRIRELVVTEETIAVNVLGTVIHNVLEIHYLPFAIENKKSSRAGDFITKDHIKQMVSDTEKLVEEQFDIHYNKGNIKKGKNYLIYKVAIEFVLRFLRQEQKLIEKHKLQIVALEKDLECFVNIKNTSVKIKIRGSVYRI